MIQATSPRMQIERLLTDVARLKTNVQVLESGYQDCYYTSQEAGRNLQSAEWPLRRAESDTPNIDSSFDGRQAQQSLSQSERNLDDNDRALRRSDSSSDAAASDFAKAQRDLQQIIADSSAYAQTLASLQQAKGSLDSSANDHGQADNQATWAKDKTESATQELRWADFNVRNVSYDRPGVDVSNDARQAGMRVDQAQWDVRDCDTDLTQAHSYEQRSGQGLATVEQQLRQAQAQLPPGA